MTNPGRSGASWNLGQSDGFSSGLYEVEALSCFIASFEKAWWIHGNKNRMLVEEINGCQVGEISVKFPVNSSHWQFLITEFQKYYGNWEKTHHCRCPVPQKWIGSLGNLKGGFGTKGPRDFCVCWLVFCPPVVYLGKWWVERNPFLM